MTNLKDLKEGYNKYCGPAVLSILTGKNTDECAYVIGSVTGNYKTTGVYPKDLLKAAEQLGFTYEQVRCGGESLFKSLFLIVKTDGMYIVEVGTHYVVLEVRENQIFLCDNHTKSPIHAASSARLMQEVKCVYRVFAKEVPEPEPEPELEKPPEPVLLSTSLNVIKMVNHRGQVTIGISRHCVYANRNDDKIWEVALFTIEETEVDQLIDKLRELFLYDTRR